MMVILIDLKFFVLDELINGFDLSGIIELRSFLKSFVNDKNVMIFILFYNLFEI